MEHNAVYGWANLQQGRLVCLTHIVREEGTAGSDWLDLCLPTGALDLIEPRLTYPIGGEGSRSWREPLDEWFVGVARRVAQEAGFHGAIIGEEVSGLAEVVSDAGLGRGVSVLTVSAHGVTWTPPDLW